MTRFLVDCAIALAVLAVLAMYENLLDQMEKRAAMYASAIVASANGGGFDIAGDKIRCKRVK